MSHNIRFGIITLFPEMFDAITKYGVISKAIKKEIIKLYFFNVRDYATDKYKTVDDKPYGGGQGMLLKVEPLQKAIADAKKILGETSKVICLSATGNKISQSDFKKVAFGGNDVTDKKIENIIFICGRYEGIDERLFLSGQVNEQWSIGDYVLTGGELAAMLVIDGIARLVPGVLGDRESASNDSYFDGLLEHPQYTRPEVVNGYKVPEVLLSGNHQKIAAWELKQRLGRTWQKRKDLLAKRNLSVVEKKLLQEFIEEETR